ncbi:MAG: hypothetical protein RL375_2370 [Pseudomonadota bacterium]
MTTATSARQQPTSARRLARGLAAALLAGSGLISSWPVTVQAQTAAAVGAAAVAQGEASRTTPDRPPPAPGAGDAGTPPSPATFGPERAAVSAGKRLYRSGRTRSGAEIRASVGASVDLPGSLAACSRCHGADGNGAREAGLWAPPLRWSMLSQPRPAADGLLARSTGYDQTRLLEALRHGRDADGRPLAAAMPRFDLSPRDEADLLAYLTELGSEQDVDPGVAADHVRFAAVLPLSGPRAALGQAARHALRACTERANRAGGVFGRRIELLELDSASLSGHEIGERATQEALLALAPWWADLDAAALAQRLPDLPLIGPLGAAAEIDGAPNRVYAVAPQLNDQARVLVDAMGGTRRRVALIAAPTHHDQAAARAAQRQAQLHGIDLLTWPSTAMASGPQQAMAWLARQRVDALLMLGPATWLRPLAGVAAEAGLPVYASYGEAGRAVFDWPAPVRATLHLSLAEGDPEQLDPGPLLADLQAIGERSTAPAIETLAYNAACLSVEALRRTGRQLSRERLRQSLERIGEFRTGLGPPLSFGPGQRKGIWGSAVVRLDAQQPGRFQTELTMRPPRLP